jgi:cellulose synthase/poly-beta-1,6-N-acetylglucosamine synthase-like glycosyltransferase
MAQPRAALNQGRAGPTTPHRRRSGERVVAIIPAHNEAATVHLSVEALAIQTRVPDEVIVVADNCTDDTAARAESCGARVIVTQGNTDKKAGALNQVLAFLLPELDDQDIVLVQDADSFLDDNFIEGGLAALRRRAGIGAVGGTFRGQPAPAGASWSARVLAHLQDNEYARYARDVRRLRGKCLVVTGTAAMFRVATLKRISAARLKGTLPAGDGRGGIYDTSVLTEDNELSFAVMTLGYSLLAPAAMTLTTEVMPTWRQLWNQRLRWKRGAVENCFQYGFTRVTRRYWGRQALTAAGVVVTALYLGTLVWALFDGGITIHPFWLGVTGVFISERFITVRDKGWRHQAAAASMYELPYELFLQATHAKAYFDALLRRDRNW